MRRVEVRRVSNGAVVVYESDRHPRTESVYTTVELALEAATAWLGGETEFATGQGSPDEVRRRFVSALIDPLEGITEARAELARRGLIGTPFDPPEAMPTAWERDE